MFIPNKGATFTKVTDVLNMTHPIGAIIYIILIFFFTYFYTSIVINPNEIAMNMKKNGGFIPGIRPGSAHKRLHYKSRKQSNTGWCSLLCGSGDGACCSAVDL